MGKSLRQRTHERNQKRLGNTVKAKPLVVEDTTEPIEPVGGPVEVTPRPPAKKKAKKKTTRKRTD